MLAMMVHEMAIFENLTSRSPICGLLVVSDQSDLEYITAAPVLLNTELTWLLPFLILE